MDVIKRYSDRAYSPSKKMLPFDPMGWIQPAFEPLFKIALDHVLKSRENLDNPLLVVEVGSWLGASTRVMAKEIKSRGLSKSKVIAIDTWLGSPEHLGDDEQLEVLYETFISNVKHEKLEDVICPFRISSAQGGHFLIQNSIVCDIVYIDAGHEYESVKLDIDIFWSILKPGGFMLFDDYAWSGVIKAVDEHAAKVGGELAVFGALAMIQKTL